LIGSSQFSGGSISASPAACSWGQGQNVGAALQLQRLALGELKRCMNLIWAGVGDLPLDALEGWS
jgi:hypothetical protein